jgi:hypothetical protein
MMIEMMGLLLGSLLTVIVCIPFLLLRGVPSWIWLLAVPTTVLLGMIFSPLLFNLVRWVAKVLSKTEVTATVPHGQLWMIVLLYFASAVVQGAAFFFLIRTIFPISFQALPGVIGVYNGAWAVGFLSVFAPSGLGVREGAMTFLLKYYVPVPLAVIYSILARLWITIFEVVMSLIGLTLKNRISNPQSDCICYEQEKKATIEQ